MDELQKLYDVLKRDGYYTKSFDEFVAKWEDGAYRDKVYQVVSRDGLYTKDKESFLTKYSSTPQQPTQQPEQQPVVQPTVKKKDDMESSWWSGDGTSESEPSETDILSIAQKVLGQQPKEEVSPMEKPVVPQDGRIAQGYSWGATTPTKLAETKDYGLNITAPSKTTTVSKEAENLIKEQNERNNQERLNTLKETKAFELQEQEKRNQELSDALFRSKTPEFISKLNSIDNRIFDYYNNINDLKKEFQPYGIVIEKAGIFGSKLIARSEDGQVSVDIDLSVDSDADKVEEAKKLRDFISQNNRMSEEEDFLNKALRAKNMRNGARINDDGTMSSVKFTSFDNKVIPTLFPKNPLFVTPFKDDWIELPFEEALKEAQKRGEVFTFKTDKEAQDFAAGSWKDISKADLEGDLFYKQKGLDYVTDKRRINRYNEIDDIINFFEGGELSAAEKEKVYSNPSVFINGKKRLDVANTLEELKKEREQLRPLVKDMTFLTQNKTYEKTRMDFDVQLAKIENQTAAEATKIFREAKSDLDIVKAESISRFNMPIEELMKIPESKITDKEAYKNLVQKYADANQLAQTAVMKFDEAKTYFDAKTNKEINSELTDNLLATWNSLNDGLTNGMIGDQLLAMTLPGYTSYSGYSDPKNAAKYISEKLASMSGTQSRVMTRMSEAKTYRDWWDVVLDDPFEAMAVGVAQSVSQMLPYGVKIIPTTTAAGAGTGAVAGLLGGPFAPITVTGGIVTGGVTGFKTGQAITGYMTEYTNALMEAVKNNGYNPLDPKSLEEALNDQRVWDEGAMVGAARGIPIAAVDYLTAGLSGKMIKPASKLASATSKIARATVENAIIDPSAEMAGELVAQGNEILFGTGRKEIDFNEVALEGMGSMGTNTPNYLLNSYSSIKRNTDINLAYNLTNYKNIASERVSDERISNWANNMQRLGKIDEDVNQKIQENVGLRREAKELMSVGGGSANSNVTSRTMELLAAKKELTSSKEKQEVYSDDVKAINEELSAMGKSKAILPTENQVDLAKISGIETKEAGEYMINGRRYTKQQFLDKIDSFTPERLAKLNIGVKNDDQVSQTLNEKLDAIQKQAAGEVSVQSETGLGKEVVEGESQAGSQAAPKQGVLSPEESQRKEELTTAIQNIETGATAVTIGEATMDIADAQAELDAIIAKEQATPEAQKQTTTDIFTAAPTKTKQAIVFTSPGGIMVSLDGNEQMAAQLYDEAIATPEEQRSQQQNNIVQKMQPLVTAAAPAVEVTPVAEVTPTPEQQAAPVEPVETFTEQDRARKQELTDALAKADKRRKNITVGETVMPKADVKAELDALNQKELSSQQPVTAPVTEAAPVAPVAPTETAPVQTLTPEQEAAELEKLFNAPRSKKPTSKREKNVIRNTILNAAKAIAKVLPKVNIVVHETIDDYINATGDTEASSGLYVPSADGGTIHINLENSNRRTAGHEVFHAILLRGIKTDAEAQRLAKAMLNAVMKSLNQSGNNQELLEKIQEFVSNYDENIQNEESLAEIFGYLADGYPSLDAPTKNIIQRFLDRIAKLFGLKSMTDNDIIDFMNTIAKKVATGEEITEKEISTLPKSKNIAEINKRFQANFSDSISKLSFVYDKNSEDFQNLEKQGFITKDKSLSFFNGKYIFLHQPDAAFSGLIYKKGQLLVEGKGGIYYPIKFHKDGYFWASTSNTAKKMADDLNKVMEQNGGVIYMALTSAPSDKLLSSTTMANAILDFFSSKAFDSNFKLKPSQLKEALILAANNTKQKITKNKKTGKETIKTVGLNLGLKKNISIDQIQSLIKEKLNPDNSSFADRKNFAEELIRIMANDIKSNPKSIEQFGKLFSEGIQNKYFKGITKTGKLSISAANMTQALSEMFTEPILKEGVDREKGGQVYAIIELNGKVKSEPSNKHESYPMAIKSDGENKVKLHILTDRQNWYNVFEDFETDDIVSKDRINKIYPTSGVSVKGLKLNTSKLEGLTSRQQKVNKEVQGIEQLPSARKQLIGKNANLAQDVRDNLQVARNMETAGKDAKTIRITTGWEKGKDNKWRYEILDGDLKGEIGNFKGNLSDVLENKELFNAYPELAKLEVDLRLNGLDEGIYEVGKQKIKVNGSKGTMLSILLHEVQHAIQSIEGFAKGGNIEMMKTPNDILVNLINQLPSKTLTREERSLIKDEYEKNGLKRLPILPTSSDITSGDIYVIEDFIDKLDILIELFPNETSYKNLQDFLDLKLLDISGIEKDVETAFEKYQKIAGEVEARNVQKRMKMTPEQRRQTTLQETEDVAREDQVIFFDTNLSPRQQKAKKELKDIIKTAIANEYSDEGIRIFLKNIGLNDADIDTLLGTVAEARTPKLDETKLPGYNEMMSKVDAMIARQIKRGTAVDKMAKNLDALLRKFDAYINATDAQKKALEQEARNRIGAAQKRAPSTGRILGAFKDITNLGRKEKSTILNNIMRLAKDAANDLAKEIKAMKVNGKITINQFTAIEKRLSKVNFSNEVSISSFVDYIAKVFKDAEYAEKKARANKLQSQIKQLSKNKGKFGNLTAFAAEFAKIDPAMVENIDEYLEMASNVKEGVQGSKIVGENVIPADMVDVGKTMEYVNKMMEAQAETIRQKTAERLQELMGVDASDLTYDQMMELLDTTSDKKVDKYKEGIIRGFIDRMFNTYSTIINDMFETGIDPFSDPDNPTTVDFKDSDKKIVEEFMAMDLSLLDAKEALRAADALNNFLTNKSTAGMLATLGDYNGRKNIREVVAQGKKAKQIKMYWSPILGKTYFQQIASIPAFFERLFKSYKTGRYIREMMGINSLVNHKADAVTAANRVINNYILEFSKKRPNNKNFQDISNIVERGIIGDLAKTIVGDAKQVAAEFNRRKRLIEQSIKILEEAGSKKETQMAKAMKEVYDKIAKDSKTIEEVKAKADQINVDAVQFWVDTWAKLFDQFADVALNVYNRVLDKNVNYVPDRFGFIESAENKQKDADGFESTFFANSNSEYFYKKEAGSLMKSTPPQSLLDEDGNSTDMYVNLSFDTNNANALMDALIDIKTAADIRQIQAFKNDSNFKNVFPFSKDATAVKERIAAMIRNIRNKRAITDKSFKDMVRKMDRIAAVGTSLLLAGPTQAISQTIPVAVNTLINSGGKLNLSIINNKDANRLIDESGMGIANRGSDAVTELETLNQKLEVAAETKTGALVQYIENLNRKYLKLYLSNFDVLIARASWITYYEKGLRKQGIKGKVDYSDHKLNKEAAQYAQDMIDRQQNISDKDLAGQFYNSDNPLKQMFIKIIMPLTTFRMNQTTRFSNDVAILISKTASTEERKEAAVSVGGFAAEMATFRAIKLYIGYYLFYSLAQFIRGEEDDEEEKKKTWDNMKKGAATSVVSDVFSPIPQTDVPVKNLFSAVLDQLQNIASVEEDDKFNIFTENKASFASDFGLLGVSIDKILKLGERIELARTGKFKDEFGNEKTISESDRALLSDPFYIGINVATVFGLNPFAPETDNVMNRITKMAKKNAMSNNQLKEAEELGVGNKKDLLKVKAEKKAMKEEAYGNYETLEEFEEKDPEKFDEYSAPGGKLYKYRESVKLEEKEKNKDKPLTEDQIEKLKKENPREWIENYGPGTEYFQKQNSPAMLQKKAQDKMREAQREQKRKMAEAKRKQQEMIRKASGK